MVPILIPQLRPGLFAEAPEQLPAAWPIADLHTSHDPPTQSRDVSTTRYRGNVEEHSHGRIILSAELAALLGPAGRAQLDEIDLSSPVTCHVCGTVRPAEDPDPIALVYALMPDGLLPVVGLAHPACRDRVGEYWPGLLNVMDHPDGVNSLALYAERPATPRAILIFEPTRTMHGAVSDTDAVDIFVADHIEAGFTLALDDLLNLHPAVAPGWELRTSGGHIDLTHPEHGSSYRQPIDASHAEWLRTVHADGQLLVVTGTGLHLELGTPPDDDFAAARRRGTLICAVVAAR